MPASRDPEGRFDLCVAQEHRTWHRVGAGVLAHLGAAVPVDASRAFVVADAHVAALHGPAVLGRLRDLGIAVHCLTFPPGEASKTRRTWARLCDRLDRLGADRRSLVIGLGGGVSTDLAGFVAATALRGLRGVLLPTSLLAMADAALGGKAGLDGPGGKNRTGAMWWPLAVLADTSLLATLPAEPMRHGLAEVVKAAVIGDPDLLGVLEADAAALARGRAPSDATIARAAAVKLAVVGRDPFEAGERRVLNFGHTVGHAIEAASGWRIPHGLAVAAGLRIEARIAARVLGFPDETVRRLGRLLDALGLPADPGCTFQEAAPRMARDKKNRAGALRFALPEAPGRMARGDGDWTIAVDPATVEACWHGGD